MLISILIKFPNRKFKHKPSLLFAVGVFVKIGRYKCSKTQRVFNKTVNEDRQRLGETLDNVASLGLTLFYRQQKSIQIFFLDFELDYGSLSLPFHFYPLFMHIQCSIFFYNKRPMKHIAIWDAVPINKYICAIL